MSPPLLVRTGRHPGLEVICPASEVDPVARPWGVERLCPPELKVRTPAHTKQALRHSRRTIGDELFVVALVSTVVHRHVGEVVVEGVHNVLAAPDQIDEPDLHVTRPLRVLDQLWRPGSSARTATKEMMQPCLIYPHLTSLVPH